MTDLNRVRISALAFWVTAALISAHPAGSEVIDIRICPLDTITFIDPWARGSFAVKRVGTNYIYLCKNGAVKAPPPGESCNGPYGDLALVGDLVEYENAEPRPFLTIWYVIDGSPCCGWSLHDLHTPQASKLLEGLKWLERDEVPRLGTFGFAGIEADDAELASANFGNPKYAMTCTLR